LLNSYDKDMIIMVTKWW